MRVAVLADIHGNLVALDATLAEVARLRVDLIIVVGDIVVGAPDSLECWRRIQELRCPVLRGNHERYVFDLGTERAAPEWSLPQFGPVHYAAAQLGKTARAELAALPTTIRREEIPDVLFVHGSSRNDNDLVFPYTPAESIDPMFADATERWLIRGHNHFAAVRLWRHRKIVTVGSVGLPLDGTPSAQFTVLQRKGNDWEVDHRLVEYDVGAATRRFVESGYLDVAGPIAWLYMREVATASFHILPFLRYYAAARKNQPELTLDNAVECFCPRRLLKGG